MAQGEMKQTLNAQRSTSNAQLQRIESGKNGSRRIVKTLKG
jgi:hypothetical protein